MKTRTIDLNRGLNLVLWLGPLALPACANPSFSQQLLVTSVQVTYTMGDNLGNEDERQETVPPYYLDTTEVTVAQYRACVDAGACQAPDLSSAINSSACNWDLTGRDNHPMNCIDMPQAQSFCTWVGRRLPGEGEWELAARGVEDATYPWGDAAPSPDDACANQLALNRTCPVGSYPLTLLGTEVAGGLADLAGNVWEWTADEFCRPDQPEPCTSPGAFAIRGGSWDYGDASLVATVRLPVGDSFSSASLGVRCARSGP